MASIIPGYEYDIFVSYRQNDNLDGWVSDFVSTLEKELRGTLKDSVSIYFDTNPHDGLLETHNVGKSLEIKLKCLIFIPVISRTYCDTNSFAWQHEFCTFNNLAREDEFGMDIRLLNGNVTSRILPIKIHDIDNEDSALLEEELGGAIRAIEFFHKTAGVNRPLTSRDDDVRAPGKILYRDQINKVANAIGEILRGIKNKELAPALNESAIGQLRQFPFKKKLVVRGIFKAGLVYLLTSVILWKITVLGSDLLNFDGNTIHLITLILIVLFPIAMLAAWFFERSPHGFIRTDSIASLENPFTGVRKKPFTSNAFITLLLLTSLALFLLFPMAGRTGSKGSIGNVEKSIAVLPFENVRKDPEQEYFSDGMMQEILNHLFKIGGLKISSASSTMKYKDSKLSASSIARELNVSFILEGNVSESVDNVRIIVSLINGKTGELIWNQDYRRSMTATNILDIQSDIALEVAANLRVAIDPEVKARIKARPTENTEAYTLFLQARSTATDDYQKASQMLTRAVSLDPGFADAYAEMAWERMYYFDDSLTREQIIGKVEPLLNKALELDNNSIMAHQTLAEYRLHYFWDLKTVEKEMQAIRKLNPSNDRRSAFLGYLWDLGRNQEAYEICKDHFEQNNTTTYDWIFMASAYLRIGEIQKASETMVTALRLFAHTVYLIRNSIRIFVESGQYKEAIDLFEKELSEKNLHDLQSETLANVATAYYHEGNKSKTKEILLEILSRKRNYARSENSTSAAQIYVAMGEKDKALQSLEQAYANHELWLIGLNTEPGFMALHGDPRFEDLVHKIGIK